jgi:hypothetical protein
MNSEAKSGFERRFRMRVLLPGAIIILITALLCGGALVAAGRGTDGMSVIAQQAEVWRATARGLDELALGQESVGLCDQCIAEAASAHPDRGWLNASVGTRLFDLYGVHESYILDAAGRPVLAAVEGKDFSPATAFGRIAPSVEPWSCWLAARSSAQAAAAT